jgi:hypothetical protein
MRVEHVAFDKPIRRACGHLERYQCRVTDPHAQERAIDRFQREQCGACRLGLRLIARTRLMPNATEAQDVMQMSIENLRLFALGVKVLIGANGTMGLHDGVMLLAGKFLQ